MEYLGNWYYGNSAVNYDILRKHTEKWRREQRLVENHLERAVANGNAKHVLDVPVGTGRFFDIYRKNSLEVTGIDLSYDMIEVSREKVSDNPLPVELFTGDIFDVDEYDLDPYIVVSVRIMNWLTFEDFREAIKTIINTGAEYVIISVRTSSPNNSQDTHKPSYLEKARCIIERAALIAKTSTRTIRSDGVPAFIRACRGYFKRSQMRDAEIIIHDQDRTLSMIDSLGLTIEEKSLVERGNGGDEYHIYLLSRREGCILSF